MSLQQSDVVKAKQPFHGLGADLAQTYQKTRAMRLQQSASAACGVGGASASTCRSCR